VAGSVSSGSSTLRFDYVEITYSSRDRFEMESPNPDTRYAQDFVGEIFGLGYDDATDSDARSVVGTVRFSLIDVYEADEALIEALDARSAEWINSYSEIARRLIDGDDPELFGLRRLLIVDEMELRPEVRGHGLGLHVLSRVVRSWGSDAATVLVASPLGSEGQDELGSEALVGYWSRLGFELFGGETEEAVLLGNGAREDFWSKIVAASVWEGSAEGTGREDPTT
jgi:GNAT superfamily N-acetyltransferase